MTAFLFFPFGKYPPVSAITVFILITAASGNLKAQDILIQGSIGDEGGNALPWVNGSL